VFANTLLNAAACTESDARAERYLEQAVDMAQKAAPQLEEAREYADLAATQFNIAYALYELGDTETAFEELYKTLALNERYGQREDQVENYRTMLEWQSADGEVDETQVDRYAGRLVPRNVRFQFGWTPFDAIVRTSTSRDVFRDEVVVSSSSQFETVLHVRPQGDDLVLTTEIVDGGVASPAGSAPGLDLAALLQRMSNRLPATVVARTGEIKSIADLDAFVTELVDQIVETARKDPRLVRPDGPDLEQIRTMATSAINAQRIEHAIRDDWDTEVGSWLGAQLELGAWYEAEYDAAAFGAPSQRVRNRLRFSVARFVPCETNDADSRCVELLVHSAPDAASVKAATAAMLTQMLPKDRDVQGAIAAAADAIQLMEVRTVLVTDPQTLRPYRREETRLTRGAVEEKGKRHVLARRDRRVETVTYRPPSSP
jgi:tetratricopeptide (TPR) repeat protein